MDITLYSSCLALIAFIFILLILSGSWELLNKLIESMKTTLQIIALPFLLLVLGFVLLWFFVVESLDKFFKWLIKA